MWCVRVWDGRNINTGLLRLGEMVGGGSGEKGVWSTRGASGEDEESGSGFVENIGLGEAKERDRGRGSWG